tara:strand:+ start:141 stop:614 length:474 start_codon:yes stop_codon:yes gene_type:complete
MSTLSVNTITEQTSGSGVKIAGHVVQVATDHDTNIMTLSSDQNYHDTGLSIAFTPKYADSIIVIQCMMGGEVYSSSNIGIGFKLLRDSSEVYNNDYALYNSSNNAQRIEQTPILYSETSGNTNARTYKVQVSRRAGGGVARLNNYGESRMVIMEIAQ